MTKKKGAEDWRSEESFLLNERWKLTVYSGDRGKRMRLEFTDRIAAVAPATTEARCVSFSVYASMQDGAKLEDFKPEREGMYLLVNPGDRSQPFADATYDMVYWDGGEWLWTFAGVDRITRAESPRVAFAMLPGDMVFWLQEEVARELGVEDSDNGN